MSHVRSMSAMAERKPQEQASRKEVSSEQGRGER